MAGLQRSNKIREDPLWTNLNAKLNLRYCMTLNGQSQCQCQGQVTSEGHTSVEVIKIYMHTKYRVCTDYQQQEQTKMQRLTKFTIWPWIEKTKVMVISEGHILVEVIKVYMHIKYRVCTGYRHPEGTKTQRLTKMLMSDGHHSISQNCFAIWLKISPTVSVFNSKVNLYLWYKIKRYSPQIT